MESFIEKMPPQDLEAEAQFLGSMIYDCKHPDCHQAMRMLAVDDFYRQDHRLIFAAIKELYDNGKTIELVTLRDALETRGQKQTGEQVEYLVTLYYGVPHAENMLYFATVVRDKSLLRRIISTCNSAMRRAYDQKRDIESFVYSVEAEIREIGNLYNRTIDARYIGDIVEEIMHDILNPNDNSFFRIKTGFYELDDLLVGGFAEGTLNILAARPSMGKTAMALDIATYQQAHVMIFSLEMGEKSLGVRMLSAHSGIPSHKLQQPRYLNDADKFTLNETKTKLAALGIVIDDSPRLTPTELRNRARVYQQEYSARFIIIDYLQLMHCEALKPGYETVSEISRQLKALARELEIPVLALSQLNRSVEQRVNKRPMLSDLRESGQLEQDADVVILLHRPEFYKEGDQPGIGKVDLAKHRNGPTGACELLWNGQTSTFKNLAKF